MSHRKELKNYEGSGIISEIILLYRHLHRTDSRCQQLEAELKRAPKAEELEE